MKILLAVDDSEYPDHAIELLRRLPFDERPELLIAHVCPISENVDVEFADYVAEFVKNRQEEGQALIDAASQKCAEWAASVQPLLLSGATSFELVKAAKENQVDLVVIGAKGRGAVSRFLLGSISDSVAKRAECSVLVVRPPAKDPVNRDIKLLFAVDGGQPSNQAIQRFAKMRFGPDSEALITRTVDTYQAYHNEYTLHLEPSLTRLLESVKANMTEQAALLEQAVNRVDIDLQEGANPADRVLKRIEEWSPDLVIVGSHGKPLWERALLGSVSLRILHHAPCSVWIERVPHETSESKS